MPIFEYQCNKCQKVSEFFDSAAKSPVSTCPHCGARDMSKLLSGFAVGKSKQQSRRCDSCHSNNTCPTRTCPFS